MGCFLACFGGAKDHRCRRRRRHQYHRRSPTKILSPLPHVIHIPTKPTLVLNSPPKEPAWLPIAAAAVDEPVRELSVVEKPEAPSSAGSSSSSRKKVTFDLNVTTYKDDTAVDESPRDEEEKKSGGEGVGNAQVYPLNHRYQNCASSDDEDVDDYEEEYDDCDFEDEEEDGEVGEEGNEEEESYESFFSLQLEKELKSCAGEVSSSPEPVVVAKDTVARDRSQYVHSVLNPVENLSKWKEVKDNRVAAQPKNSMKENLETNVAFCSEPSFKSRSTPTKPVSPNPSSDCSAKQEVSVDASLSNWLVVTPDISPMRGAQEKGISARSNSSVSREDRPILGALTVEDIKQSSVNSSPPRRSPNRTHDDIPIVGTVGSYWSSSMGADSSSSPRASGSVTKGIPNTTSKYGEDKRVNWHSTPFEVRLERALNEGSAADEACPPRLPAAAAAAATVF